MTPSPNKIERRAPNEESSTSAEGRSTSGFDLLANPFVLLSISPTATAQEIKQAHEDAVEDGIAPVDVLQRALQQLLTPKLRIEAEVGGLLDVHSHLANQVIAKLHLG